ncbi:MAG: pantothenate kinase [Chloroflexi bacterium]|nr:pantothenate kinase [Chloroflexota bacterium]MBT18367.1 pantothenate kinase [Dehalococcoidia bacterium]|tara:strand:+ start:190 stop:960 length:771 start_codon:yes stop_codon:yes gene_type:complete
MLLTIDIGNTNVTLGVFSSGDMVKSWRLSTDIRRLSDEYSIQVNHLLSIENIDLAQIDDVAICSVVPPLTSVFESLALSLFKVQSLIVGAGVKTGVRVHYDSPHDVGPDRVVDAAAAFHFYGGPAIIVDFGTATVFDAISHDGSYLGGAIAPGLSVSADALYQNTSMLRRVEMLSPETAIGTNTVHSLQSGLVLGYAGLVETMVARFKSEMGSEKTIVIGTGGLAETMASETSVFDIVDQSLTLRGLAYIHELNYR